MDAILYQVGKRQLLRRREDLHAAHRVERLPQLPARHQTHQPHKRPAGTSNSESAGSPSVCCMLCKLNMALCIMLQMLCQQLMSLQHVVSSMLPGPGHLCLLTNVITKHSVQFLEGADMLQVVLARTGVGMSCK